MKLQFNSPIYRFAFWGFITSLGAPLGFYLHNFLFVHTEGMGFLEHIIWIHQHNTSTILYIGLGSNIFFTAFGAVMGRYSMKLARAHRANEHLKKTKHDLIKHFLAHMRVPASVGLESLLHLKDGSLSSRERENLFQYSIKELQRMDESIRNLIDLHDHSFEEECKISEYEIVELIKKAFEKNEVIIAEENFIRPMENYQIKINAILFEMVMDQLFNWIENNELEFDQIQISYFNHRHKEFLKEHEERLTLFSSHPLIVCLEFKLTGQNVSKFEVPLLAGFVDSCQGTCFYYNDSVLILLPAEEVFEEKGRAA